MLELYIEQWFFYPIHWNAVPRVQKYFTSYQFSQTISFQCWIFLAIAVILLWTLQVSAKGSREFRTAADERGKGKGQSPAGTAKPGLSNDRTWTALDPLQRAGNKKPE